MQHLNKALRKYLQHYALSRSHTAPELERKFQQVLILPAYRETAEDLLRIAGECSHLPVLCIVVLNQPESTATDMQNLACHTSIRGRYSSLTLEQSGMQLFANGEAGILLVDAYTPGRQLRNGVGEARKLGCDIGLHYIAQGAVANPWLHNIDADVSLPGNYFSAVPDGEATSSAIALPFTHHLADSSLADAIPTLRAAQLFYDLSLHYYVAGLAWAGSPYAYHSLGSTLIINAEHYAMVRGFPLRAAGEDFHILNKLRKIAPILSPATPRLAIRTRLSERTPFGTGTRVQEILSADAPASQSLYYHPQCFSELKNLLRAAPRLLASTQSLASYPRMFKQRVAHARKQSIDEKQRLRQFHTGFDALQTLRFIHSLRAQNAPSISVLELLAMRTQYSFIDDAIAALADQDKEILFATANASRHRPAAHTAPS